jgi:2-polyprenyl-6-methoxyphenol hydroxylase-like FAD-dependent oxidoreductase
MTEHSVVVAGGGPTGMMLAGELALAGVNGRHCGAVHQPGPRRPTLGRAARGAPSRLFDQHGIADRFLSEGNVGQVGIGLARVPLDISDFPPATPYGLALWQKHIERILADWVAELGVPIYRGPEVTSFAQDDSGVDVEPYDGADGRSLRAEYLVGCDGGRCLIRKAAGIECPGWDAPTSNLIAEVEMAKKPE